ncbi:MULTISPECIES: disulfide bond formation protein DsbA [unclassified Acidithiobacillus]|uniref:disulfide bond formation protein DsbA n=1 Tax=unclassified Acidithiobacillus TaxID=2614800 RepID=UPI001D0D2ADB|nr:MULTISPECIES: disulfide bond formation protein DsbA [unclassified Acidithiobacillus]
MSKIKNNHKISAFILCIGLVCAAPAWAMDSLDGLSSLDSSAGMAGAGMGMSGSAGHAMPHFQPYRTVHLTGMNSAVIEAMAYECPFCRALNGEILRWAQTLPSDVHFQQMPAAVGKSWIPMTRAFFTVEGYNPALLPRFDDAAFAEVQDRHSPYWSLDTYRIAAEDVGVPANVFAIGIHLEPVKHMVFRDVKIMAKARIRKTPSLIICGHYVLNPGDVQGNYSEFFQMANALVSRCISENRLGGQP